MDSFGGLPYLVIYLVWVVRVGLGVLNISQVFVFVAETSLNVFHSYFRGCTHTFVARY
jgi:hypothetical protein